MGLVNAISDTNDKAAAASQEFLKKSQAYYKLKIFQQLTLTVSMLLKLLIMGGLVFVGMVLGAIGLALYIGNVVENPSLGFVCVGIAFLILAIVVYCFKKMITNTITKKLSETFFD